MISHWDELQPARRERGHIAGSWTNLTGNRSVKAGVSRVAVDPGCWSTPAHVHGAEEEFVFVLGGGGLSWQDGTTYEIGSGDCVVHRPGEEAHTLRAGDDGLDVLIFGQRVYDEAPVLPRAGAGWYGAGWLRLAGPDDHPWAREAAVGAPEVGAASPRPSTIVNVDEVPAVERRSGDREADWRDLGRAGGSEQSGIKHVRVLAGRLGAAPHCHSAEEEIFVVLEGDGELQLWPAPQAVDARSETHPVRRGSVVARPAGTRVAHSFRAGGGGLAYLAYGTRDPDDMTYYPRSNKVFFRGLGLIARLESLEYGDGED